MAKGKAKKGKKASVQRKPGMSKGTFDKLERELRMFESGQARLAESEKALMRLTQYGVPAYGTASTVRTSALPFKIKNAQPVILAESLNGLQTVPFNPGNIPWLRNFGGCFEWFAVKRIRLNWRGKCLETRPEIITISIEYDASDAQPYDEFAMLYHDNISCMAHEKSASLIVDVRKFFWPKYRTNKIYPVETGERRLEKAPFSINFNIAGSDSSEARLGELWADYEIDFSVPQWNDYPSGAYVAEGGGAYSAQMPFGGTIDEDDDSRLPVTLTNNGIKSLLTFDKPGTYLVDSEVVGTGLGASTVTPGDDVTTVFKNEALESTTKLLTQALYKVTNAAIAAGTAWVTYELASLTTMSSSGVTATAYQNDMV